MLNQGYVQIYTGDGKGKTTAAVGLAVRALSRGLKVCIIQFLKKANCFGECVLLKHCSKNVTIINTGSGNFIIGITPSLEDKSEAARGISEAKSAVNSNKYDMVILDEVNVAINLKLIELSELMEIVKNKPQNVELILTGRGAAKELIEMADLVTEMKEIKHYYKNGVKARIGIEE